MSAKLASVITSTILLQLGNASGIHHCPALQELFIIMELVEPALLSVHLSAIFVLISCMWREDLVQLNVSVVHHFTGQTASDARHLFAQTAHTLRTLS